MQKKKPQEGDKTRKILKRTKVIGQTEYIDRATGALEPVLEVETQMELKDFNFEKIWLAQYFDSVEAITNKKRRLADWLIEHKDKENKITYTYRQMAKATGFSLQTVSDTMKALIDSNLVIRINQGCYAINPDIVWKGGTSDRLTVINRLRAVESLNDPEPEQLTFADLEAAQGGEADEPESREAGSGEKSTVA